MIASITSPSSCEAVRTSTRVSGAIVAICLIASTPLIPGMFRSMTTTSGASGPDLGERLGAGPRLADHVDLLRFEQRPQSLPVQVVVIDEQDSW